MDRQHSAYSPAHDSSYRHPVSRGPAREPRRKEASSSSSTSSAVKTSGKSRHDEFSPLSYRHERRIGEGSFGKVDLIQHVTTGRQVVVKILKLTPGSKDYKQAKNEIRLLMRLRHEHIIAYLSHELHDSSIKIFMEYATGGDLEKRLKRDGTIADELVCRWTAELAMALQFIHSRGVLHRDVKTSNIFVMAEDDSLKLGDFGIAKELMNTAHARTMIGTPYYISPEIVFQRPYGAESDVWALGCVLYEMCTGRHPFTAGNMDQLMMNIMRGLYPKIASSRRTPFARIFDEFVSRMLMEKASDRLQLSLLLLQWPFSHYATKGKADKAIPSPASAAAALPPARLPSRISPAGCSPTVSSRRAGESARPATPTNYVRAAPQGPSSALPEHTPAAAAARPYRVPSSNLHLPPPSRVPVLSGAPSPGRIRDSLRVEVTSTRERSHHPKVLPTAPLVVRAPVHEPHMREHVPTPNTPASTPYYEDARRHPAPRNHVSESSNRSAQSPCPIFPTYTEESADIDHWDGEEEEEHADTESEEDDADDTEDADVAVRTHSGDVSGLVGKTLKLLLAGDPHVAHVHCEASSRSQQIHVLRCHIEAAVGEEKMEKVIGAFDLAKKLHDEFDYANAEHILRDLHAKLELHYVVQALFREHPAVASSVRTFFQNTK